MTVRNKDDPSARHLTTQPSPMIVWRGKDVLCRQFIQDPLLDLLNVWREWFKPQRFESVSKNVTLIFRQDVPLMLGSDGAPRCKYTGVKGGGHKFRFTFNDQHGDLVPTVFMQGVGMNFQLKHFWAGYEKQQKYEKGKDKTEIDGM